jgi:hypothetical protein
MKSMPPTEIDQQRIKDFERDGVLYLPSLFDESWVKLLRAGIERNLAQPGPDGHDIQRDDARRSLCSSIMCSSKTWARMHRRHGIKICPRFPWQHEC